MGEIDHEAALAPYKDLFRELLFQPVQWLLGSNPLMGRVDPAAPAGALHAEQIAEWDPDLHPAIVDLQPHECGKPEAGALAHGLLQMLHGHRLQKEPCGVEGIAGNRPPGIPRAEKQGAVWRAPGRRRQFRAIQIPKGDWANPWPIGFLRFCRHKICRNTGELHPYPKHIAQSIPLRRIGKIHQDTHRLLLPPAYSVISFPSSPRLQAGPV